VLKNKSIFLRSVEPSDAPLLMLWENDTENWKVTDTEIPFSLSAILQLIEQQQQFRSTGMLRLMICSNENNEPVGALDLYDADFRHKRAAVGILIGSRDARGKGFASESLELIKTYATEQLGLHNLYCSIQEDNVESQHLFEKSGFELVGKRKEWFQYRGKWIDERMYLLCLER
jgi:diamine N-acetyltransferase